MATEIPSHNLREIAAACVALLRNPKLTDDELYQLIPGPDFAGGGQIISPGSDVANVYTSGRGSIKVRARWEFEELARGQWQWVVTELPPGTSTQRVLEEIEDATNPKVRANRKSLTAQQQQVRTMMLGLLDTVRDESGKEAAVRLVFEPRSSRIDRDEFVNTLLAQTSLEGNVSVNLVCLGLDGRPAQRDLRDILTQWLEFRRTTMTRRTRFRLDKVTDRIHVLEGRMVVYLNVDEVIQTIRESDEPRPALMERFKLSERQAEDILEMRLRQLARLEGIRIEQELEKQRQQQAELTELLENPRAFKRLMIREIEADTKLYGDDRRTLIETAEKAVLETRVVKEPVTVIVSQKGWLRSRQGHGHDAQQFNFKSGDSLYDAIECHSTDELVAMSNTGRVYTVAVANLPSARGDGQPVTAMIDMEHGARIVHTIAAPEGSRYLLGVRSGYGFISAFENMTTRQRAGKQFITLESGDALLKPVLLRDTDDHLVMLSKKGRMLVVALSELRVLAGGGRGTRLMDLDADDGLEQVLGINSEGLTVSGIYRRRETTDTLSLQDLEPYIGRRARRGRVFDTRIRSPRLMPV